MAALDSIRETSIRVYVPKETKRKPGSKNQSILRKKDIRRIKRAKRYSERNFKSTLPLSPITANDFSDTFKRPE
jgi:hypothetical protein